MIVSCQPKNHNIKNNGRLYNCIYAKGTIIGR